VFFTTLFSRHQRDAGPTNARETAPQSLHTELISASSGLAGKRGASRRSRESREPGGEVWCARKRLAGKFHKVTIRLASRFVQAILRARISPRFGSCCRADWAMQNRVRRSTRGMSGGSPSILHAISIQRADLIEVTSAELGKRRGGGDPNWQELARRMDIEQKFRTKKGRAGLHVPVRILERKGAFGRATSEAGGSARRGALSVAPDVPGQDTRRI